MDRKPSPGVGINDEHFVQAYNLLRVLKTELKVITYKIADVAQVWHMSKEMLRP